MCTAALRFYSVGSHVGIRTVICGALRLIDIILLTSNTRKVLLPTVKIILLINQIGFVIYELTNFITK